MPTLQLDQTALTKKIQTTVAETVASTMHEILSDPEYFDELQAWVKRRLTKSTQGATSLQSVKNRLAMRRKR